MKTPSGMEPRGGRGVSLRTTPDGLASVFRATRHRRGPGSTSLEESPSSVSRGNSMAEFTKKTKIVIVTAALVIGASGTAYA